MRKQRGISLVELMVSITVGLILMTGVVQLFLSSRATFSTQQAISRVQETGRLAMEFMAQDIRMAGYLGCMSRNLNYMSTLDMSGANSGAYYNFDVGIEGFDVGTDNDSGVATLPGGYPANVRAGTDVLVTRSANDSAVSVMGNNNGAQLFADDTGTVEGACADGSDSLSGLCRNDILVVSDCRRALVFQATNLSDSGSFGGSVNVVHSNADATPGNDFSSWGGQSPAADDPFGTDSEIIKVSTYVYYIADNNGNPTLYQRVGSAAGQPLLEGVENMQITYGRDTNGDGVPDLYRSASAISGAAWSDVSSVRLELLVRSTDDNVLAESQPYTFPSTEAAATTPTDRRLRQVFVSTIGIRSRLP